MSSGAALDDGYVAGRGAAEERFLGDGSNVLPLIPADKSYALTEDLAHEIAGVVIDRLGMLVGVFEHGLDMFRSGQDTVEHELMSATEYSRKAVVRTCCKEQRQTYTSGVMPDQIRYRLPNCFPHRSLFSPPSRNLATSPWPLGHRYGHVGRGVLSSK